MVLAYSLYMATTVFLLQIQMSDPSEHGMYANLEALRFCVRALQEVATVNTGKLTRVQLGGEPR